MIIRGTTSPDQLSTVTDATGNNAGFYNLTSSTTAYAYDANGNLTNDYYKGLTITYNYLNKTSRVTVTTGTNQFINYTYDGAGSLIRKQAGIDPSPESAESMTGYNYAGNNPVMMNDPMGDKAAVKVKTLNPYYVGSGGSADDAYMFDSDGGGGGSGPYDQIGRNSDPNWQNNGAFNDGGPFSSGARAGGGDYTAFWTGFFASGQSFADYKKAYDQSGGHFSYGVDMHGTIQYMVPYAGGANSYSLLGFSDFKAPNFLDVSTTITQAQFDAIIMQNGGVPPNEGGEQSGPTADQYLFDYGLTASSIENFSGAARVGSNLILYRTTESGGVFIANQFVKTIAVAKIAKIAGVAGAVAGVGFDAYGYFNGSVSGGKFTLDTFMAAAGLTGVGTLPSLAYFAIDAYYPGGVVGYSNMMSDQLLDQYHNKEPNWTNNPIYMH